MSDISITPLPSLLVQQAVETALAEDFGRAGDITSQLVVPKTAQAKGVIAARQNGVLAGLDLAMQAFQKMRSLD